MWAEGQNHWYLQCFGRFLSFLRFPENRPIELLVFFGMFFGFGEPSCFLYIGFLKHFGVVGKF